MTPNALRGAEILLDFIGKIETGRTGLEAYRTIYGHKESTLPKPITDFTLDELLAAQARWGKEWGSSAAGKFQIIRKTLQGLVKQLGLPGDTKFGKNTQDMLGLQLLKGRGYENFVAGRTSVETFALSLAKEWASLPVLVDAKGASRNVKAGQSYYAGDGLNKALISTDELRKVLADVQAAINPPPVVEPVKPPPVEAHEEPIAPEPAKMNGPPSLLALIILVLLLLAGAAYYLFAGAP